MFGGAASKGGALKLLPLGSEKRRGGDGSADRCDGQWDPTGVRAKAGTDVTKRSQNTGRFRNFPLMTILQSKNWIKVKN